MGKVASLKKNLAANFAGQFWVSLMGIFFIPVYVRIIGIEAYGLIGIFAMLQAWFSLLDMGMAPTLSREMARYSAGSHSPQSIWDLLRSIEIIGFCIAVSIAFGTWLSASWIATAWLHVETLPIESVINAFSIMGIVTGLRFLESLYRSAFLGLQDHVALNFIDSIFATLRGVGAIAVLLWFSPTILTFFLWQGFISLLNLIVLVIVVYRFLPSIDSSGHFSLKALREVWRFATGMIAITFMSILLNQGDVVVLSGLLPLSEFGYYTLASSVVNILAKFAAPITLSLYPRLTALVASKNTHQTARVFHVGAQMITVCMGAPAIFLIFFGEKILNLWTKNPELSMSISALVAILSLAKLLKGMMLIPVQVQYAYGWTTLVMRIDIIAIVVLMPSYILLVQYFGVLGVAWSKVFVNFGVLFLGFPFMFRRVLKEEKKEWYKNDILIPIAISCGVAFLLRFLLSASSFSFWPFGELLLLFLMVCFTMVCSAPLVLGHVLSFIQIFFRKIRCE